MMRACTAALIALIAAAAIACGDSDNGGSPNSPSGGGNCSRPSAPGDFRVALSGNSATFTWAAVGGANDYLLRVGTTPSTADIMSTNTSQTTFTWNGTGRGTCYATSKRATPAAAVPMRRS